MYTKNMPKTNNMKPVTYPVFTVIVFAGSPSSDSLTECQRISFETEKDALRFAGRVVRTVRWRRDAQGSTLPTTWIPPCASVFEDSPSRGLGRHVAERTSSARRKYLAQVAQRAA